MRTYTAEQKQRRKDWYEKNKLAKAEYDKQYRKDNPDKAKRVMQHYLDNKEEYAYNNWNCAFSK